MVQSEGSLLMSGWAVCRGGQFAGFSGVLHLVGQFSVVGQFSGWHWWGGGEESSCRMIKYQSSRLDGGTITQIALGMNAMWRSKPCERFCSSANLTRCGPSLA
eukprot:scaffold141180_cov23-Tisochrysis_lutea.AAC.1